MVENDHIGSKVVEVCVVSLDVEVEAVLVQIVKREGLLQVRGKRQALTIQARGLDK